MCRLQTGTLMESEWRTYAAADDTPLRHLHEEHKDVAASEVMTKVWAVSISIVDRVSLRSRTEA